MVKKYYGVSYDNRDLMKSTIDNDFREVTKLLENGADVHADNDLALRKSAKCCNLKMVTLLLEHGANIHASDDRALRWGFKYGHLNMIEGLLQQGADIHCKDNICLQMLQQNFNEKIANIILEYCDSGDYYFFPDAYIKSKIVSKKSSRTM